VPQGSTTRTPQASISAALAAASAGTHPTLSSPLRFPGDDGGRSLAEMAQSDLDAALQLLADRAQYITGAHGAAIALRRKGKNDMLCRASTGSNVPELGALLSTEFGLSGESVRTRQPLRCDDTERDPRVNREGCRELGIASVVVMPVVNDDEVLGVFELFSGKVNAFGERDLSALVRLSQMVETAVRLARAAESVQGKLIAADVPVEDVSALVAQDDEILDDDILDDDILGDEVLEAKDVAREPIVEVEAEVAPEVPLAIVEEAAATPAVVPIREAPGPVPAAQTEMRTEVQPDVQPVVPAIVKPDVQAAEQTSLSKKPLFWSAAMNPVADAEKAAEPDQSNVPPSLRNLRTCEACGFPVSPGRALCVECEEKKWRGQLRPRRAAASQPVTTPVAPPSSPKATASQSMPVARAFAAAAQSASVPVTAPPVVPAVDSLSSRLAAARQNPRVNESADVVSSPVREVSPAPVAPTSKVAAPDFVLSAGLAPSQSWIAANKYVLGTLLLVAAAVAAIVFLR